MYPQPNPSFRRYRFEGFEVDTQSGELRRDGIRVPLQEIPFRFLAALLERPGRPVGRDQLREEIWPRDINLDFDSSLDTAVRKVRKALGDSAKEPRFIETIPGRGYRFLREVHLEPLEAPPAPWPAPEPAPIRWLSTSRPRRGGPASGRRGRKALALGAGALLLLLAPAGALLWKHGRPARAAPAPPRAPSVLALPAKVQGPPGTDYLADAVPSALSTLLASSRDLDTRLPPTRDEMDQIQGDLNRLAALYGVEHLILTTVTVRGGRLVLDLQIADASNRRITWARQMEGAREDFLELSRGAANAIKNELRRDGAPLPGASILGSEAELVLAEGNHYASRYWNRGLDLDYAKARAAFERLEALAPSSAEGPGGLAMLFHDRFWRTRDPQVLKAAQAALDRALERDPGCARAWMVRSKMVAESPINAPEKTVEYAVKAACLAPRDPRMQHGLGTEVDGSNGILIAAGKRCMELDPLDQMGYSWAALGLILNGRAGEGLSILDQALRLDPGNAFNRFLRFQGLFSLGRMEEARAAGIAAGAGSGNGAVMLALAEGDADRARRLAGSSLSRWKGAAAGSMDWANRAVFYAPLLARLGMKEEALGLLERSVEAKHPPPCDWLGLDPHLRALSGDPRFARVLEASKAYARICAASLELAKARGDLPAYLEPPLAELKALARP